MTTKEWLSQYPVLQAKYYRMYGDENNKQVVAALREKLDRIENAISSLKDPLHEVVLSLRYMEGNTGRLMPWRDVAFAMYHNDSEADLQRVHRLHRKAIEMVKLPEV